VRTFTTVLQYTAVFLYVNVSTLSTLWRVTLCARVIVSQGLTLQMRDHLALCHALSCAMVTYVIVYRNYLQS
jgi:hypothetical protein